MYICSLWRKNRSCPICHGLSTVILSKLVGLFWRRMGNDLEKVVRIWRFMQFEMNRCRSRRIWRTSCTTSRKSGSTLSCRRTRTHGKHRCCWTPLWSVGKPRSIPIGARSGFSSGSFRSTARTSVRFCATIIWRNMMSTSFWCWQWGDAHRMITTLFPLTRKSFRKKLRGGSQRELKMCCRWRTIACWYFSGMA